MKKLLWLLLTIVLFLIWEVAANKFATLKYFISSPTASFEYALNHFHDIINSALITSLESTTGFVLAIVFSFTIMLFCLLYPKILKLILPVFITSQILPMITLAPLFIALFGMGLLSKIAMVVLMCFFPIFINFSGGVESIPANIKDFLYVYNAGKRFTIFKITIPLSLPYIFVGLKISATMAIMGAIVAEFLGARDGLGKNLYLAPKYSQPELMVCSIFLTSFLGWLLFKAIVLTEKKIGRWYLNNTKG